MSASTATETKPAAAQRGSASIDPNDRRYPRPKWLSRLRSFIAWFWWLFSGLYAAGVAFNLLVVLLKQGFGGLLDVGTLLGALALDKVLPAVVNGFPHWIGALMLAGVIGIIILGWRAKQDKEREQKVLELRAEQDKPLPQQPPASPPIAIKGDHNITIPGQLGAESGGIIVVGDNANISVAGKAQEEARLAGGAALEPQGPPFDHKELLPAPEHFVGRQEDLDWLLRQLQPGKTAAITALGGLGGSGKTALAAVAVRELRWRGRFRDGVAVVLCQGLTDPADVLARVLTRFDPYRRAPEATDLPGLSDHAQRVLHQKKALVVLDNVEPELTDLDKIIAPLRAAGAALLLTARHTLPRAAVPLEASRMLDLLSDQEALDLFAQSYGRADAAALSPDDLAAAKRIVTVLERHTLAVKLAGAFAADAGRDLAALAGELESDPLKVPEGETPRAVALAFAKSTEALPDDAFWLFAALAAFPTAEFSRQAVLGLLSATDIEDSETALNLLVLRKLVDASTNDAMPAGSARERLRLHQLMRSFAADHFAQWPEDQRHNARLVVAQYYAAYTNAIPDRAKGYDEANITAALEWAREQGQDELTAELCSGMQYFWHSRWRTAASLRYLPGGLAAAEKLAHAANERTSRLRAARLASTYGFVLQHIGKLNEAEQIFQDNLSIRREVQDRQGEGVDLTQLGQVARQRGQLEQAEAYFQQALVITREVQDRRSEGAVLTQLGQVARQRGQLEQAEAYFQQALVIHHEVQDRQGEGITLAFLADIALARGDFEQSEHYYQQALAIARQTEDVFSEKNILGSLENLTRRREQSSKNRLSFTREEAERAVEDAAFLAEKLGLSPDDPQVPQLQEQLRQALSQPAQDEPEDEEHGLTREEAERAAQDAAFLAEKLGIPADHPGIPAMQERLRQMLAEAEQAGEAGEGAPPNE